MVYVQVIVGSRTQVEQLTYAVPAQIIPYIRVGSTVKVPLRRQVVTGVVVSLQRRLDPQLKGRVKEVVSINKQGQGFTVLQIKTIEELAKFYGASLAEVAYHALNFPQNVAQNPVPTRLPNPKTPIFVQAEWTERKKFYTNILRRDFKKRRLVFLFPVEEFAQDFYHSLPARYQQEIIFYPSRSKSVTKLLQSASQKHFCLIGQQSASFVPLEASDVLIVDQPDHIGYRSWRRPYLSTKQIAQIRSRVERFQLIFGGDLLPVVDYPKKQSREWRIIAQKLPPFPLTIYSRLRSPFLVLPSIEEEMAKQVRAGKPILLMLASRSWAPVLFCQNCHRLVLCRRCDRPISLLNKDELVCSYCSNHQALPAKCPNCHEPALITLGEGVGLLNEYLSNKFPQIPVKQISSLSTVEPGGVLLTVATEKILSFPQAHFDHVFLLSMDRLLGRTDPDGSWHLLNILMQLRERTHKISVQTYFPDHWLWGAFASAELESYYQTELKERLHYRLPPYGEKLSLIGSGSNAELLSSQALAFTRILEKNSSKLEIGEPNLQRLNRRDLVMNVSLYSPQPLTPSEKKTIREQLPPAWTLLLGP